VFQKWWLERRAFAGQQPPTPSVLPTKHLRVLANVVLNDLLPVDLSSRRFEVVCVDLAGQLDPVDAFGGELDVELGEGHVEVFFHDYGGVHAEILQRLLDFAGADAEAPGNFAQVGVTEFLVGSDAQVVGAEKLEGVDLAGPARRGRSGGRRAGRGDGRPRVSFVARIAARALVPIGRLGRAARVVATVSLGAPGVRITLLGTRIVVAGTVVVATRRVARRRGGAGTRPAIVSVPGAAVVSGWR